MRARTRLRRAVLAAAALAVLALAPPGAATTASRLSVSARLSASAGTTVAQGRPFAFTATISSQESFAQEVELRVVQAATGTSIPFWRELAIVSANLSTTVTASVNPAQWFSSLGPLQIVALVDGQPIGPPLAFEVQKPALRVPLFANVTQPAGVSTTIGETSCGRFSSGAAWADVNGDGRLDLFVTRLSEPARLFIQQPNHTFADEAAARGVAGYGVQEDGAVFADVDNNGTADLTVVGDGITYLYRNDGRGYFTDVTAAAGLTSPGYMGVSASYGDYDNDGKLDLYVTTHSHCVRQNFLLFKQEADLLYHGHGDGTFTDVSTLILPDHSSQPNLSPGAGFQTAWVDLNADNRQDVLLVNDYIGAAPDRNRLWQNGGPETDGSWRFTDISANAGVNLAMNAMGIAIGDYNRDLKPDFAVSNLEGNKLFANNGNMTFTEVARRAGVDEPFQRARRPSVTWGMEFRDFNLDGWPDLYVAAGYLVDWGVALGLADTPQHNQLFVNAGDGTFATMSASSGADDASQSRGIAAGDYDRDGREDVYVVNQGGESHLFRNVTPFGPKANGAHWLEVDTVGTRSNRDGCGAILVTRVRGAALWREVFCGSTSVSSGSSKIVHIGLGTWGKKAPSISLEITWPSGTKQTIKNVKADRLIRLTEPKV